MVRVNRENRSKFYTVKCPDCEHEQKIFQKASTTVECLVCGKVLAVPKGGNAEIKAEIIAQNE
ncbi:MAG: 30S ribosomal protein S27e [Methanomicrobium sp.]|jgi:Ribosomal protein S27E|uniref:30S ribosomal protein S27e n=1 Tax=Methanomicrobium mobile TaxID=2205 RepID=UPI0005B2C621|nr:30S ribosomal protein S27e [Methanomicrobium mobile]MBO7388373.1 30S ribosomal protein S27e [Methanomicrobium sp.]MBP5083453.1 30S ribosomal protein S27e [Methanomicrobium sp.]MBP5475704.1 30S ribosomal protein S27e [Methanomicrobium sp.]MBQ3684135.1 30S ribosomal protein S27e [Methanomicrobium sp.]MBQ3718639.1 30S ribosomal protein S27e [Methanomicrobium sp.]